MFTTFYVTSLYWTMLPASAMSSRQHLLDTHFRTTKTSTKSMYAKAVRNCNFETVQAGSTLEKEATCVLKEMRKKHGRVKPPRSLPATFKNPKIFCYTLAGYPYPTTLPMVMNALALGCDQWQAFSSHASLPNITKVYDQVNYWPVVVY
jgi:hypothetical protein